MAEMQPQGLCFLHFFTEEYLHQLYICYTSFLLVDGNMMMSDKTESYFLCHNTNVSFIYIATFNTTQVDQCALQELFWLKIMKFCEINTFLMYIMVVNAVHFDFMFT